MNKASHTRPVIAVMVVDDHDLVRFGLVSLLNAQPGIHVIADASSGEEALDLCRKLPSIDCILMDINMPGIGGLEATSRISKQWPHIGIIIISVHGDGPLPRQLLKAGAKGYLTKGNAVDEMVTAIRDVSSGGRYIAKDIAQKLALSMLPGDKESLIDRLSKRELQVLMMIAQGHKTQDISETLKLSPKTVSTYRMRLHEKLEVETDVEMLHLAMKHGILDEHTDTKIYKIQ
jgi:two-component system invasion response regulator UvrY